MSRNHSHRPKPAFRFDSYQDGCDEAFDIYRTTRKRPLARLRYWTATGLTSPLAELFVRTPGLRDAAQELLAEMQAALVSDDAMVRYTAEREAPLFVGLWAAIARTERTDP